MSIVGYARVSTTDQSLDVQRDKLLGYGCEELFSDKVSGATAHRKGLNDALRFVRKGDTLVVTRLDRLARSVTHLLKISSDLQAKGVNLAVIDQQIDTSTPAGKLMFSMLGAIAEFERDLLRERVSEGVAKAKEKGVEFGRPRALTPEQAQALATERAHGALVRDLMRRYGVSRNTVYLTLRQQKTRSKTETEQLDWVSNV